MTQLDPLPVMAFTSYPIPGTCYTSQHLDFNGRNGDETTLYVSRVGRNRDGVLVAHVHDESGKEWAAVVEIVEVKS